LLCFAGGRPTGARGAKQATFENTLDAELLRPMPVPTSQQQRVFGHLWHWQIDLVQAMRGSAHMHRR